MHIIHTSLRDPSTEGNGGASQGGARTGFNPFEQGAGQQSSESTSQQATQQTAQTQTTAPATQQQQQTQTNTQAPATQSTTTTSSQQATTQAPVTQSTPAVQLSQEQLTQLLQAARPPTQAGAQGQPQMTDAEFKRLFNIHEVTADTYEKILGVKPINEAQVQALNDALQGVSKQSITIMRHLMDQRIKEIQGSFQPIQQTLAQQREQQVVNEFYTEYPGLKDFTPMLKEIVDAAKARGLNFASPAEAKSYVAAQAAKLLGKQVTDFQPAGQSTQQSSSTNNQTSQQSGTRQMSTTSMGGRSGSSGGAAPSQTTAERIFAPQSS